MKKRRSVFPALAFLLALVFSCFLNAGLMEEDLTGQDTSGSRSRKLSPWEEVAKIMGGRVPQGRSVADILGPLPSDTITRRMDSLGPERFINVYELADRPVKRVMRDISRARLRELSRRGEAQKNDVELLLGAETGGIAGSEFFDVPPVPGESFKALVDYMEYGAELVGGRGYILDEEDRGRLSRSLKISLAASTRQTRRQYRDFDLVWAIVRRKHVCAGEQEREKQVPGMLWLYHQLWRTGGIQWLPSVSPDMEERVRKEGGALFLSARQESASMPSSLAVLCRWRCSKGASRTFDE